jgi:hypothetical protein
MYSNPCETGWEEIELQHERIGRREPDFKKEFVLPDRSQIRNTSEFMKDILSLKLNDNDKVLVYITDHAGILGTDTNQCAMKEHIHQFLSSLTNQGAPYYSLSLPAVHNSIVIIMTRRPLSQMTTKSETRTTSQYKVVHT